MPTDRQTNKGTGGSIVLHLIIIIILMIHAVIFRKVGLNESESAYLAVGSTLLSTDPRIQVQGVQEKLCFCSQICRYLALGQPIEATVNSRCCEKNLLFHQYEGEKWVAVDQKKYTFFLDTQ